MLASPKFWLTSCRRASLDAAMPADVSDASPLAAYRSSSSTLRNGREPKDGNRRLVCSAKNSPCDTRHGLRPKLSTSAKNNSIIYVTNLCHSM